MRPGSGRVDAVVLAGEVEVPVAVEVTVGAHRAEFEDGLGALEAPAGAADVQAVADQVPTRSLDHPGGDRPAGGQRGVVAEELLLGLKVADARVDAATLVAGQSSVDGLAVDRGDGLGDPPGQDADRVGRDPRPGVRVTAAWPSTSSSTSSTSWSTCGRPPGACTPTVTRTPGRG